MQNVPASHLDLLNDDPKAYAFLATTMPDGSPQLTPVWFSVDGEHILINTNRGRVKDRNMRARPKIALVIMRLDQHFRYLQMRGEVIEVTGEGAVEHIHHLSNLYDGADFNLPPNHDRVLFRIKPNSWTPYAY
ncbi:MAG: PPOX class F420-dependent oxidoreductase [Anaerolineae bacterium]|nr:PPOX class F420-dependent oxidoreductase [Anaerolineae bacterium]